MSDAFLRDERLFDLLTKQAIEGVTATEKSELDRLLAKYPDADSQLIDRIVASVMLAGDLPDEPLPASLRARIESQAVRELPGAPARVTPIHSRTVERHAAATGRFAWFAAAACLVLAVIGWWPRLHESIEPPAVVTQTPPRPLTPAEQRLALLQHRPAITQTEWTNTGDPASEGVKGDVVWDNARQLGFVRFTGLAANDPRQSQYQLWIFDAKRDERYPIDGGVFDIPAGATEVVIPIKARLAVNDPAAFAVTIEQPGGVVVSAREHVVALAKIAAG
jgi:anti-sigma-K factor RskA